MKNFSLFLALAVSFAVSVQGWSWSDVTDQVQDNIQDIIDSINNIDKCSFCPSGSSCIEVQGQEECKCDGTGEIVPPHGFGTAFCDDCGTNQVLKEYSSGLYTTGYCVCADGYKWDTSGNNCIAGDACDDFNCGSFLKCKTIVGVPVCIV